ncbi:MAG TPA: hypothetical protein VLA15_01345 [Desulfurivibrionaceae bacterium]|nr:hypothetical protein [Desulfurivibrionaceae bacterium]
MAGTAHRGHLAIPRFYRFVIRYVTPLLLLTILGFWLLQNCLPVLTMRGVAAADRPYLIATRLVLVCLCGGLALLVRLSWRRRGKREETHAG